MSLQVFFRYVLEEPLPWSEELARYLFVWAALLAAAVTVGRNDKFTISILAERLPCAAGGFSTFSPRRSESSSSSS